MKWASVSGGQAPWGLGQGAIMRGINVTLVLVTLSGLAKKHVFLPLAVFSFPAQGTDLKSISKVSASLRDLTLPLFR